MRVHWQLHNRLWQMLGQRPKLQRSTGSSYCNEAAVVWSSSNEAAIVGNSSSEAAVQQQWGCSVLEQQR